MMPRIPTSVPLWTLLVSVLVMPSALESAQFFGHSQAQGRAAAAASQQTPPQTQPAAPRSNQSQQQPSAERFLGGGRTWWKEDRYKKELNLQPQQVREIDWIFADRVKRLTPYYDQWQKERAELDRLARERTVDDATFSIQVGRVESLRSKLNETRTVMLYQIMRKLTPQQYQKLQEMNERDRGRGGSSTPRAW